MLEHVSRGQKLTTDLVNGIIDKANGQMIPSNGAFVNTQNGTLFINEGKSLSPNTPFITSTFLDCKIFKRAELESRPFTYKDITSSSDLKRQIFINFGNSTDAAKSLIQYNGKSVDEIILAGGTNQNLDYILDDTILTPANDSNNKLTLANDGFVNTAILFSNSVKIYGQIYKYFKEEPEEGEEVKEPKFYFVVTDQIDVKERVLTLTGDKESNGYVLKKTYQTQLGLITQVGTNSNANKANYLINAKPITLVDDVNISSTATSADIPPDASLPDLHLSSVENYERSDGSLYRRLYNFDSEVEEFTESDLSNNYDFIIRHTNDDGEKYIVYKSLSSLSGILSVAEISGDSQVDINQRSVELSANDDRAYYQLYKFNDGCYVEKNNKLSNDGEGILIRKENNEGKYDLAYLNRESLIISGDADIVRANDYDNQYSIQFKKGISNGGNGKEDGTEFYQIYNFDNGCSDLKLKSPDDVAKLGLDYHHDGFLFRLYNKQTYAPEVRYMSIDSLSNLVAGIEIPATDTAKFSNQENGQRSIQIAGCVDTTGLYYQLYNIDAPSDIEQADKEVHIEKLGIINSDDGCSTAIFKKSLLPPNYEFVVRELGDNGCGIIHYMPLSVGVNMPQVDTLDSSHKPSKSIENHFDDIDGEYLELYNFNHPDSVREYYPNYDGCIASDKFFIDGRDAILIKKITNDDTENEKPELQYMSFKSLKNYINYTGDSNLAGQNDANEPDQYSIELKEYENQNGNGNKQEYFQLYKFDEGDYDVNRIDLTDSYKDISQNDSHFLVRETDSNGQPVLKYKKIYMKSDVNGCVINEVQQSITNIYEQIEIISAEISGISADGCFWQQGADYSINYGHSIGDSYNYEVINLDNRTLQGCWNVHNGGLYVDSIDSDGYTIGNGTSVESTGINTPLINVDNTTIIDGCGINSGYANIIEIFGCTVAASSQITIGNTTINEQQLQALLALLS